MHIKNLRFFGALAVLVALTFTLSGCFDLGDFEDEEDYYSCFGVVGLIAQDESKTDYSLKDYFYNKESVNDFGGSIVSPSAYIYLVLPLHKDMEIDSFSLYLCAESEAKIRYSLFLSDSVPSDICRYDEFLYEIEEDDEGNPRYDEQGNPVFVQEKDDKGNLVYNEDGSPKYVEIAYDDPPASEAVASGEVDAKAEKWCSFTASQWTTENGTAKTLPVRSGEYILVRFENNGGGGKKVGEEKVSFKTTNLMVRALGVL